MLPINNTSRTSAVPITKSPGFLALKSAIIVESTRYISYARNETTLRDVRAGVVTQEVPVKLVKETIEAFPSYYKTYTGTRQTRIFPPIRDV